MSKTHGVIGDVAGRVVTYRREMACGCKDEVTLPWPEQPGRLKVFPCPSHGEVRVLWTYRV